MTTAIYCRMSKDRTGAGLGISRQEKECRELADRLGLEVSDVYADNDISASTGKDRPGYQRLLADVAAGHIKAIVCWHPDRLTRRTSELEAYISATANIPTYTVSAGHFDLTSPAGRATAKTIGAWAQAEVEQKAERQKAKNRQLAESGQRVGRGGPIPFGYADHETPHPVHGELVRQAYRDVLAGKGLAGVAMDWQKAGAPIPQSKTGRWDRSSVKRVLMRASNAGLVVLRGKILPGTRGEWEPLVSVADYYAVRALLSDPTRRKSPGNKPVHLLSGIATCGTCGAGLRRQKVSGKRAAGTAEVYACANRRSVRGDCAQAVTIPVGALEEWFTAKLLAERGDRPALTATLRAVGAGDRAATLAELDARARGIALQMAEADADMGSLAAALADVKAERKAAEEAPVQTVAQTFSLADSWDVLDEPEMTQVEARRSMIRQQLESLRVMPVGRGRRLPIGERVEVRWA